MPSPPEPETAPAPLDPNPYADGTWLDLVVFRLDNVVLFRFEPVFVFAMSIALFLAGAHLYRAGALWPQGNRIRIRLMLAGAIAWPIDMALGVAGGDTGVIAARYGTAAIVAFGLLGLIAEFYVRRTVGAVGRRLSEVGRMALSSYVLQNIVASIICYGWGFGLADRLSGTARIPFTLAVYVLVAAVVTVFAHVWLARFDKGPVEWLWHASYLRIVSMTAANGATMATMTSNPADEVVAVYDSERNVIGEAPRSVVYADGLWHATAGVLVRSCDGERIYVHRRTDTKSIFPGMHDCLAGGVVDPGETIETAAIRELEEELGIVTTSLRPLTDLSWDGTWQGKPMRCHMFAFEIVSDGPFQHQASEIVDGWWWTDAELREHLADPAWPFVPDTRLLVPGMLRSLA